MFCTRAVTAVRAARSDVGGGEHEVRVAAAEFEHGLLDLVAADRRDRAARGLAAGQGRRRHPPVAQHPLDAVGADQQRLEAAVGEARPAEEVLQVQRGLRHVRGVLEQARRCPPSARARRTVRPARAGSSTASPRGPRRAAGSATRARSAPESRTSSWAGSSSASSGRRVLGVPAQRLRALRGLRAGRRDRLAHLQGHGARDVVPVAVQEVGGPQHEPGPLARSPVVRYAAKAVSAVASRRSTSSGPWRRSS